ncbi:uncharacterized protein LOC114238347 [Balaenoptera acutorostrata]|uniref:Uncharacterized protein LOC114238347 n=1 Tax=Balaenoptera acutorostrata TaxID=9767 RepID=A0A452CJS1_BALAC|nr:uncharacterized protein LOC114238347 [Balaenoptera acutorostrata]
MLSPQRDRPRQPRSALFPQLGSLAQHCPSAPAAGLGKVLSKVWPPTRKSLASAASLQQLDLQLDLPNQQGEPILHSPVVLTQGPKSKERHLLLFRGRLVIAKQRGVLRAANARRSPATFQSEWAVRLLLRGHFLQSSEAAEPTGPSPSDGSTEASAGALAGGLNISHFRQHGSLRF